MKIKNWTLSNLNVVIFVLIFLFCSIYVYAESGKIANCSYLNLRSGAGKQFDVLMVLKNGDEAKIIGKQDDWYQVTCRGKTGWVKSAYLDVYSVDKTENMVKSVGYVNCDIANVRSGGSLIYDVLFKLSLNSEVSIIKKENDWYKIVSNGRAGWVYASLVSDKKIQKQISEVKSSTDVSVRSEVVKVAKSLLGSKYAWGGTGTIRNGVRVFDCSGFVQFVYKQCGIDLKRSSSAQSTQGKSVPKDSLRPGDLVFFDTNGGRDSISHVGIYLDDGKMIHSSTYNKDVIISDINKAYYRRTYIKSKNVID